MLKYDTKKVSFGTRIFLRGLISSIVVVCVLVVLEHYCERALLNEKKIQLRDCIQTVTTTIKYYDDLQKSGFITLDDAKQRLANVYKEIFYGDQNNNYFFVLNYDGIFVSHPNQKLIGQSVDILKDADGKGLGKFIISSKNTPHQFVYIQYKWNEKEKDTQKISILYAYPEWGWIIGTGILLDEVYTTINNFRIVAISSIILFIIISIIMSFLSGKVFAKPIHQTLSIFNTIAKMDLSQNYVNPEKNTTKEINEMYNAIINLKSSLRDVITALQESSQFLSCTSEEIAGSAQMVSNNASTQASSLEEITSTIEEITANSNISFERAKELYDLVELMLKRIDSLYNLVSISNQKIKDADITKNKLEVIINLIKKSIDEINIQIKDAINKSLITQESSMSVIDIADQTHLLSLNATIEAARAGVHGMGFAVVASEIGKLSEKSTEEAKKITQNVADSNKAIDSTFAAIQIITSQIQEIVGMIVLFGSIFTEINTLSQQDLELNKGIKEDIQTVANVSNTVCNAMNEIKLGLDEIVKSINIINQSITENASSSEELAAASENIASQSEELSSQIKMFKI